MNETSILIKPAKRLKYDMSVIMHTPLKKKQQTTITSFFQMNGSNKPMKIEFTNSVVMKKRCSVSRKQKGSSFRTEDVKSDKQKAPVLPTEEAKTNDLMTENKTTVARSCPYYKKIPDTTFAVDAFSYGSIPGVKHYFLSHFHSDHYGGLTKYFTHPIYCTLITAKLASLKLKVPQRHLNVRDVKEPFILDGVIVELFDANHCPGSVMFLFHLPDGRRILHTGDFRATPNMTSCTLFSDVNVLYLDTTYLDPQYCFPPQEHIINGVIKLVRSKLMSNSKTLFVCGSYTIGKERLFLAIAKTFNLTIWAAAPKRQVLHCLDDEFLNSCLVTNGNNAQVHVLSMYHLSFEKLQHHQSQFNGAFDEIVAFRPTGWTCQKSTSKNEDGIVMRKSGSVAVYDVPYSEHSSFLELKQFVQTHRPQKVIPTVTSSGMIKPVNSILKEWLR